MTEGQKKLEFLIFGIISLSLMIRGFVLDRKVGLIMFGCMIFDKLSRRHK